MSNIVVPVGGKTQIVVGTGKTTPIDIAVGTTGPPGPPGPPGPQGGTPVVAIPYDEWPPPDPQPNTLYLRLAP